MDDLIEYKSTVDRWPGSIWTGPYLTFPQLQKWEDALEATNAIVKKDEADKATTASTLNFYGSLLPAAVDIVKKWQIEGLVENVTAENFPASLTLVAFVVDTVTDLYRRTNYLDPKSQEQP